MSLSNPYLTSKNLTQLDFGGAKTWQGETTHYQAEIRGHYLARELYHLDGGLAGFERIFFNEPKNPKRPTYNKGYNGDKTPLFTPVGISFDDLAKAKALVIVGGFADAVTVYNAFGCKIPTLGIQGELNTPKLISQLKDKYPNVRLLAALDGDDTGRRVSILSGEKWCVPSQGDWNDLYVSQGLQAVSDALKNIQDPIPAYTLESPDLMDMQGTESILLKELASASNPLQIASICWTLTKRNAKNVPIKWSNEQAFIDWLMAFNYRLNQGTVDAIKGYLSKAIKAARKKALSFITMSERKYNHDYTKIKSLDEIPTNQRGITLISAPHGIGKTERVGIPFIQSRLGSALALCHLRSLVADMATRFNITHYYDHTQTIKDIMERGGLSKESACRLQPVQALAVCLPSIVLTLEEQVKHTGTVLIDEVSQVLSFMALAEMKGIKNKAIFDRLCQVIRDAEKVLVMDADLDDSVIEFFEMVCPDEVLNIYEMQRPATDYKVEWIYGTQGKVTAKVTGEQRIISALADDKRLIIPTDSQATAKAIESIIRSVYPDISLLNINADTTETKAVKAFLARPNKYAHEYQVVIHSPSMRSGVSITEGGFDLGIGIFTGTTICPQDVIQMLRRDRNLKDFLLCIEGYQTSEGMKADDMRKAQESLDQVQASKDGRVVGDLVTNFDLFRNSQREKEESAKASFATNLYHMLQAYKFKITHCEERADDISEITAIKRTHKAEWTQALVNAPVLSLFEFERLQAAKSTTIEEKAALEKTHMAEFFGTITITDEHLTLWNDGQCKKPLYLLRSILDPEKAQARDDSDKPLSLRTFDKVKTQLLTDMIEIIGLEVVDGELRGEITTEHESAFTDWHKENELILQYLTLIPVRRPSKKKPTGQQAHVKKSIKGILDKALIKTETTKQRKGERKDNQTERTLIPATAKMQTVYEVLQGRVVALRHNILKENAPSATKIDEIEVMEIEVINRKPLTLEDMILNLIRDGVSTYEDLEKHVPRVELCNSLTSLIDAGLITDSFTRYEAA